MQSLNDGKRWVHEPLRLSVFIESPTEAIDDIIRRHDQVRRLVDHHWLHVFQIAKDGTVYRRNAADHWQADQLESLLY
jgi:uncharacterized protein YbcC (UPF0753/DUF2309 family)